MFTGPSLSWVSVVLAALCVPAALIAVPLLVPEDKGFWTFCAFTASLLLLLGVACLYTRGDWFWIASSGVLFGLSVIFLPFLIRAKPVREMIGGFSRPLLVLAVDVILFANMMNMISLWTKSIFTTALILLGCAAGGWLLYAAVTEKRGEDK